MHIGISIPQLGTASRPAAVRAVATAAEQVGYASVWVTDRHDPPSRPGHGSPPAAVLDPVAVLGSIAATTRRTRLGVSTFVVPWYRPAVLGRAVATLQALAGGRITVGYTLVDPCTNDWPTGDRGAADAEGVVRRLIDELDMATSDRQDADVAASGTRPPVLIAGLHGGALTAVARLADGWNPEGLTADELRIPWARIREFAATAGRDPERLLLVERVTVRRAEAIAVRRRPPFQGSVEQIAGDLDALRAAGVHEVILGVDHDLSLDEMLDTYARLTEVLG